MNPMTPTSRRSHVLRGLALGALALLLAIPGRADAEAFPSRFGASGYFRLSARPDLQAGGSRLGYWNLYGRLLNEGSYGELNLKLDLLQATPGTNEPWAAVYTRIAGSSFANSDPSQGRLGDFRASQMFVRAGNILLEDVTWQLGTIEYFYNDLHLYDARPGSLFFETLGLFANYQKDRLELLVGVGDSGFNLRGSRYTPVLTGGTALRYRLIPGHLEVGLGAQVNFEPTVEGNRFSPHQTPGFTYESWIRGEAVSDFYRANPTVPLDLFPSPEATSNVSYKGVAYVGFGGVGPILWNNLLFNFARLHPQSVTQESFNGRTYDLYVARFTDERFEINAGNEMSLRLIPDRLDAAWSMLYGLHWNADNQVKAGEDNRMFYSTVLRLQAYVTPVVHVLAETSLAQERSLNGNLFREHHDSVFTSTNGAQDARGLEFGDSDVRNTWQGKAGLVFQPKGPGIYSRPSLRLLYGLQYSSQQAAFGNGYVEDLDQYNVFIPTEAHWHSVISIEAEAWF